MLPATARVERTKTPEQIRDEAAKATAADMAALYDALNLAPNDDVKLQVAAQMYWRHREEIISECTRVHFVPDSDVSSDTSYDPDGAKLTH